MQILEDFSEHQQQLVRVDPDTSTQIHVFGHCTRLLRSYTSHERIQGLNGHRYTFATGRPWLLLFTQKFRVVDGQGLAQVVYAARTYRKSQIVTIGLVTLFPRLSTYLCAATDRRKLYVPFGGQYFPLYEGEYLIPVPGDKNNYYLLGKAEIRAFGDYDGRLIEDQNEEGQLIYRGVLP